MLTHQLRMAARTLAGGMVIFAFIVILAMTMIEKRFAQARA